MNVRLAIAALVAIPILALAFFVLTRAMEPLLGYTLGLCFYWAILAALVLSSTSAAERSAMLVASPAGRIITPLCLIPVLGFAIAGMGSLGQFPTFLLLPIALAAILNGFLEELFWRGALVPEPRESTAALAVLLFASWHVALLAAYGISLPGGPATLLLGATFLGSIWMAARMRTGTIGLSALSHAGVNLFAFMDLTARNLPQGAFLAAS